MAHTVTDIRTPSFGLSVLKSVWNFLVALGESTARARMLRDLSEMSDEQLAARGMTRQDIVRRVFDDAL